MPGAGPLSLATQENESYLEFELSREKYSEIALCHVGAEKEGPLEPSVS